MQLVTLQELKDMLNITFSAQDTVLTTYGNLAEGFVLQYVGVTSKAELLERLTGTEAPSADLEDLVLASMEMGVRYAVGLMYASNGTADVWKDGLLVRLLMPYKVPGISPGTA